jgi:hypothetical protein
LSSFLFPHPPQFFVVIAAILILLRGLLAVVNAAIGTAHRFIGLRRRWRESRQGR